MDVVALSLLSIGYIGFTLTGLIAHWMKPKT